MSQTLNPSEEDEYLESKKANELWRDFERVELELKEYLNNLQSEVSGNKNEIEA